MIITICIKKNCLKGSSARLGGAAFFVCCPAEFESPGEKKLGKPLDKKEKHWITFSERKIKWQLFYKFE